MYIVYYNIETLTGQYNIIIINIDLRGSASETRYIIIMTCGAGILKKYIYIFAISGDLEAAAAAAASCVGRAGRWRW